MRISIKEFCDKYKACQEGREWALKNCKTMADVWATAKHEWLVWVATREGVLSKKDARLFSVWCCRQIDHLITDPRSRAAVDVAEKYANGMATEDELDAASDAARAAARAAASDAARDAARDAACAAAWAAAWDAAWDAAWSAVRAAAWAAASDAAWDAASDAQDKYLREMYSPFKGAKK